MKLFSRPSWASIAVASMLVLPAAALAQDYTKDTITFTVPFPPGGGTDILARQVVDKIVSATGWSIIVQNQPGAGGNIGMAQLARTAPDGLNIGMGQTSNLAVNPSLYKDIPYDALSDFSHIGLVTTQPMAIVTFPGSPYQDLAEVIAAAKANPGAILYGTPGSGTVAHLSLELLATEGELELTHVPYPGIAQAITDVMSGVVDIYIGSVPSVLPHIRAGSVRPLAVTSAEPNPVLPETRTVASFGFDGYNAADWKAIVGPAGMPEEMVAAFNAALNEALQDEALRALLIADGSTPLGGAPEEFTNYHAAELETWAAVIEASGATVD